MTSVPTRPLSTEPAGPDALLPVMIRPKPLSRPWYRCGRRVVESWTINRKCQAMAFGVHCSYNGGQARRLWRQLGGPSTAPSQLLWRSSTSALILDFDHRAHAPVAIRECALGRRRAERLCVLVTPGRASCPRCLQCRVDIYFRLLECSVFESQLNDRRIGFRQWPASSSSWRTRQPRLRDPQQVSVCGPLLISPITTNSSPQLLFMLAGTKPLIHQEHYRGTVVYACAVADLARAWKLLRSFCSLGGMCAMQ